MYLVYVIQLKKNCGCGFQSTAMLHRESSQINTQKDEANIPERGVNDL